MSDWVLPPDQEFDAGQWFGLGVPLLEASKTFITPPPPICKCGAPAVLSFVVHAVHHCTEETPNWAALVCSSCDARLMSQCQVIVADDGETCRNCGLTIDTLSAIIVNHSPLYPTTGAQKM